LIEGEAQGEGLMQHTARCHCGALRAHVTGAPLRNSLCHCLACRRRTGAPVHWGAYFPPDAVRLEGESRAYTRAAESGARLTFRFCPTCGTNIFWRNDCTPDRVGIAAGCFAGLPFPEPTEAVRECQKLPWIETPGVTERWEWGGGMTSPPGG
jgi:hypothetical protein